MSDKGAWVSHDFRDEVVPKIGMKETDAAKKYKIKKMGLGIA